MTEGPHLLTTEMLQALLAARDRPPQTSYPKLWDPEPFEGEKAKFKTFLVSRSCLDFLRWGSTGNVGWDLWRKGSYSHFRRTHTSVVLTCLCVGSLFSRYPSRPAWSLRGSFSHALHGLVVLTVSVTPSVVSSRLFLTRLAWARCSHGIRHTRRGLFVALSHTPCVGLLFLRYPSRPARSLRGSFSHALRGLVVLGGVVVAAPVTGL